MKATAIWAIAHPKAEPRTRSAGQWGGYIPIVHSLEVRVCDVHAALSTRWRSSNGEILQRLWTWKGYHLLPLAKFLITLVPSKVVSKLTYTPEHHLSPLGWRVAPVGKQAPPLLGVSMFDLQFLHKFGFHLLENL